MFRLPNLGTKPKSLTKLSYENDVFDGGADFTAEVQQPISKNVHRSQTPQGHYQQTSKRKSLAAFPDDDNFAEDQEPISKNVQRSHARNSLEPFPDEDDDFNSSDDLHFQRNPVFKKRRQSLAFGINQQGAGREKELRAPFHVSSKNVHDDAYEETVPGVPVVGTLLSSTDKAFAQVVSWQAGLNYDVKKSKPKKSDKMSIVCCTKLCKFRINTRLVGEGPTVKYTKVQQEHNCPSNMKRVRGYTAKIVNLTNSSAVAQFYIQGNSHDTSALVNTVNAAAGGVRIQSTVARKLLDGLSGRQKLDQFTQFAFLSDYVNTLKLNDPHGTFEVHSSNVAGDNRFEYIYIAWGVAKKMWLDLRQNFTVDGCAIFTIIRGALLINAILGSDNELMLLALYYCSAENGDHCARFIRFCVRDFPPAPRSQALIFQDAGQGLIQGCNRNNALWRRCVRHLAKNLNKEIGSVPSDFEKVLYILARCTTQGHIDETIVNMREDFPHHQTAINWVVKRMDKFVSHYFIELGFRCFRQITNNPAEQVNEFILPYRKMAIIDMIKAILEAFAAKHEKNKQDAMKRMQLRVPGSTSQFDLVPSAVKEIEQRIKSVEGKSVIITLQTANRLHGSIKLNQKKRIEATVELSLTQGTCICSHCRVHFDTGLLCACACGLIVGFNIMKRTHSAAFSCFDPRLAHEQLRTVTWVSQYRHEVKLVPFCIPPSLTKNSMTMLPWSMQPSKPGRRKKDFKNTTRVKNLCTGCGEVGHNVRRCVNVNLDDVRETWETGKSEKWKLAHRGYGNTFYSLTYPHRSLLLSNSHIPCCTHSGLR